jgi:hypothetical protein
MWVVPSAGCTVHVVEKKYIVTGTSIYLINSVTRHIILDGGSSKKHKERECTVRSESRCALRLRYVDLVVSIEVAVEVCCCLSVFSC